MDQIKPRIASILLMAFSIPGTIFAQDSELLDVKHSFTEQRQSVLRDLESDKYREITSEDRNKVVAALNRIANNFGTETDISRVHQNQQVAIYNDQNLINTILTQAASDSRLVCRREKTIGSNMPQNNCLTVAERRRLKDRAQDDVSRAQRTNRVTN